MVVQNRKCKMAVAQIEIAFNDVCKIFNVENLNLHQRKAIKYVVETKNDVFVSLPTGCGKSLIYCSLPIVYSSLGSLKSATKSDIKHIVIVVSPLINLMKDQVSRLTSCGITAIALTEALSEDKIQALINGEFSIVFGSPESWLNNDRWRQMVGNNIYKRGVRAVVVDKAHVVSHWYGMYYYINSCI